MSSKNLSKAQMKFSEMSLKNNVRVMNEKKKTKTKLIELYYCC